MYACSYVGVKGLGFRVSMYVCRYVGRHVCVCAYLYIQIGDDIGSMDNGEPTGA